MEILNKLYTLRNNALKAGVNPNKFKKIYENNNVKVKEKEKKTSFHTLLIHIAQSLQTEVNFLRLSRAEH